MSPDKGKDSFDYDSIFDDLDQPEPTWRERFPRRTLLKFGVPVLSLLVLLGLLGFVNAQINPGGAYGQVNVEVAKGASFNQIATQLEDRNVVKSAFFLRLYTKLKGAPNVQAGEYAFNNSSNAGDVLSVLKAGPKEKTDRLTIPEGFRLTQIAEAVGAIPGLSAADFYEVATSGQVTSNYSPPGSKDLEGLLFPDTYLLSASDTELTLLQRMVNEFDNQVRVAGIDNSGSSIGHTPYETITIASMIESEAKVRDDQGKISQVIENRLFKAMPLQIDATVLYAMGNTKKGLSFDDLKYASPYNTYQNQGLPPGPISAPGAAAIKAALQPTPGPWLYYVVTGADGSHSFGSTLEEHNANINLAKQRGLR